jgi:hypothetical protein
MLSGCVCANEGERGDRGDSAVTVAFAVAVELPARAARGEWMESV